MKQIRLLIAEFLIEMAFNIMPKDSEEKIFMAQSIRYYLEKIKWK